jgi:hypothetical protein
VFILKVVKVTCFDTLSKVWILKKLARTGIFEESRRRRGAVLYLRSDQNDQYSVNKIPAKAPHKTKGSEMPLMA